MKNKFIFLIPAALLTFIVACEKDPAKTESGTFSNGVFITNEGPFQNGTGTVTFYQADSHLVKQNIYENVNGRPLGNIVQSMALHGGKGYIVVNNAARVEVVDAGTFRSAGTIKGFTLPRFFLGITAAKAYVSDWSGQVAVVDLATQTISSTIAAGKGPEYMVKAGNYVFVANSGGFTTDNTVTVIDQATDIAVKTIVVGDNPSGMVTDAGGRVWVFCKGNGYNGWPAAGDTPGSIVVIDPATLEAAVKYTFPSAGDHPEKPVINSLSNTVYFLYNNGIYSIKTDAAGAKPSLVVDRAFYALGFDKASDLIYASDPRDYQQSGWVLRYNAATGAVLDSLQAGVIPGGFVFTGQE